MASLPGHSVPDTSLKNELSKLCVDLQARLSNVQESMRVRARPARKSFRAVLNRSAAVSSNLFDSREMVKENMLNNLLCISGEWGAMWGGRLWILLSLGGVGVTSPCCVSHGRNYNYNYSEDTVHCSSSISQHGSSLFQI